MISCCVAHFILPSYTLYSYTYALYDIEHIMHVSVNILTLTDRDNSVVFWI